MIAHIGYYVEDKKNVYKHTAVLVPENNAEIKFFSTGDPETDLENATAYAQKMGYAISYSKSIGEYNESHSDDT